MSTVKNILIVLAVLAFGVTSAQPQLIIQTGHVGKVNEIRFSPDDKFIASAGEDGKVIIWDMKTGKQFSTLEGHNKSVTSIFFHPTESVLISGSLDSSVIFWDYLNNKILNKIKKLSTEVTSVSSSSNGAEVYIAATSLYIYNYATKKIVDAKSDLKYKKIAPEKSGIGYVFYATNFEQTEEFIGYRKNTGEEESDNSVKGKTIFCPDNGGKDFYSFDKKNELSKFIYANGDYKKRYCVIENISKYKVEAIHSSEKLIAMSNREKLVYVYDRKNLKKIFVLGGHSKTPNSLAFSQNGNWLVSSDETGIMLLWSMETGKLVNMFSSAISPIADAVMDKDQEGLFILYKNGDVKKWIFKENVILHSKLNSSSIIKNVFQTFYCNKIISANDSLVKYSSVRISKRINESIEQIEIFEGNVNFGISNSSLESKNTMRFANDKKYDEEWTTEGGMESFIKRKNKSGVIKRISNTKYKFSVDINESGLMKITSDITKQKVNFAIFNDRDFLFSNDSSYYWASKQALLNVGFKYQSKIYDFIQFDAAYNRPDIILPQLPFMDSLSVIGAKEAYKKRIKILGMKSAFEPEKMPELVLLTQGESVVNEKKYQLKFSASTKTGELKKLFILLNGVPYPTIDGLDLRGTKCDTTFAINLEAGKNNIQCFVNTLDDHYSLRENFNVFYDAMETRKPNLYLLTIGSSKFRQKDFDLQYPSKDIADVAILLSSSKVYKKVFTLELKDEAVLRSKLATASAFLSAANEDDQIIVFYAGHGVLDKDFNYYMSTYDIDFAAPEVNGIAYDSLEVMLGKLKCRKKVVLMDACHSGEIDKEDLVITTSTPVKVSEGEIKFRAVGNAVTNKSMYGAKSSMEISKMLFADTRLNNGVNVISSAGGAEYAIEGAKWNNGVFTYSLINGLKNKEADLNKDGEIWVNELQEYLGKKVSEITGGKQTPTSRAENLISNFRIW